MTIFAREQSQDSLLMLPDMTLQGVASFLSTAGEQQKEQWNYLMNYKCLAEHLMCL